MFMVKCSDPCGDCKPKCCDACEKMDGGKRPPFCKCEHKKINCVVPYSDDQSCAGNGSQDYFCPKCKKKYKCAVSCERKNEFDCECGAPKYDCRVSCEKSDCVQHHVHEFQGSTMISGCHPHNHRFAFVSGEAIKTCESHVHEVKFKTDFAGHYHHFKGVTSNAIPLPDGKHTHFIKSCTSLEDSHKHDFQVASMIENPTH